MRTTNQRRSLARTFALACALAPAAAWGQGGVKVSGFIDAGIYRDIDQAWKVGPIQRSNLAFSGGEDLGGGVAFTFRLSTRFETDTGTLEESNKPLWHDEATVGLTGAFGSIQVGRRMDALYANDWIFDPWNYYDRIASPGWDLWRRNFASDPTANRGGTPDWGRLNNGIFYDSPDLAGFTLHLSGSPESAPGDRNKALMTALRYQHANGAAMIARGRNSAGDTVSFVGLKLIRSAWSVMGGYDLSKSGASTARALTLGASVNVGPMTYRAGVGRVDVDGVREEKMLGLGVKRALSKRTSVYADFARKVYPARAASTYGVGMVHTF
ncbi:MULTISPECIES: porin [unclassified Massilia]|uniref:porin n=1 Tax=unclassified Massilia TaxID=2609279 RepID=UPI001780FB76|nr:MULTISPECIES: porin [unclassified Massilia]MBD8528938.1 porin [Massilia sp. CFBP 13647]MBD8673580.1 porin [Massilia sp. CFBP 13721]